VNRPTEGHPAGPDEDLARADGLHHVVVRSLASVSNWCWFHLLITNTPRQAPARCAGTGSASRARLPGIGYRRVPQR
jgi:hypothetical protein